MEQKELLKKFMKFDKETIFTVLSDYGFLGDYENETDGFNHMIYRFEKLQRDRNNIAIDEKIEQLETEWDVLCQQYRKAHTKFLDKLDKKTKAELEIIKEKRDKVSAEIDKFIDAIGSGKSLKSVSSTKVKPEIQIQKDREETLLKAADKKLETFKNYLNKNTPESFLLYDAASQEYNQAGEDYSKPIQVPIKKVQKPAKAPKVKTVNNLSLFEMA